MSAPAPLVPADVDLRDFPSMPFEVQRYLGSDSWCLSTHEERSARFCLECAAWHQVPAGSLPDDDRVLAHLSQAGTRWPRIKAQAMRGWIKCSDGRWYHPVVAEKVLEGWARHRKASSRGKAGAAKRWGTRYASAMKTDSTSMCTNGASIEPDSTSNARAIEIDSNELELELDRSTPASPVPPDPIFGSCLDFLTSKGVAERNARSFLGLMRKNHGDALVIETVEAARKDDVSEPLAWLRKALDGRRKPKGARARDVGLDLVDYSAGLPGKEQ